MLGCDILLVLTWASWVRTVIGVRVLSFLTSLAYGGMMSRHVSMVVVGGCGVVVFIRLTGALEPGKRAVDVAWPRRFFLCFDGFDGVLSFCGVGV